MAMQQTDAALGGTRSNPPHSRRPRTEYKRQHDVKKIFLVAGLAILSWISTCTGMLELVEANLGDLDLVFKVAIGASVGMLMLMVVWLLDQLFNESTSIPVRVLYVAGYLFLTLISVGFSFGFYWKFLESRSEASRGAESAVTQVQAALHGAETRLSQMQAGFDALAAVSTQKALDESTKGNSCPNSRPGDGPRRRLRDSDAASFSTASQFVQQRSASIKTDIASLDADLQKIVTQDKSTFDLKTGTRNEFIKALGRKIEIIVSGFNAFRTDPQLKQLRTDFAERADKTTFPDDGGKTFSCPDAQIQASLHSAIKSIDALPVLEKPEVTTVEGADATIEAFRRLNVTLLNLVQFKLPTSSDQIRAQQARAIQTGGAEVKAAPSEAEAGLSQRDYIPLAIALFVDICLLLVSIPKPLSATERTRRRRAKADGEVYRTLDDLYAIHDDPDARAKMEPLRHIAFDYMGHDYVAVPLIASREGAGSERDGSARNLSDDDMLEAQFIVSFFASQESGGPFKRASFPPVGTVRARLKKLGSKWAGIQSFRVYRFAKGAWSDFVLDMVVGADHELGPVRDKQLEARLKKNEMKSNQIVFESELKEIEHEAIKSAKRKEAELNTLMIESNITTKQQEADLRRREMSAHSELNTLGLEANITAKKAEIERTRRQIARDHALEEDELDQLTTSRGFDLRAEPQAPRKPGFWDKILGTKDEPISAAEPSLERKTRRTARAPEPQVTAASAELSSLRDTVSELAIIMRELASQQASQVSLAARTAAAGKIPDPTIVVERERQSAAATGGRNGSPVNGHNGYNGHAHMSQDRHDTSWSEGRRQERARPDSGRQDADSFGTYRPGQQHNGQDYGRPVPGFDASMHPAGSARLEPEFQGAAAYGQEPDASSVYYMPAPAQTPATAYADAGVSHEPTWQGQGDDTEEFYRSEGGAAIAYPSINTQPEAAPHMPQDRRAPSMVAQDNGRTTGKVRFPDAFRWAADSTMTGGVHQIEPGIEPLVTEAIEVGSLPVEAPELRQAWSQLGNLPQDQDWNQARYEADTPQAYAADYQPDYQPEAAGQTWTGDQAPQPVLPPAGISTTGEIESFLAQTHGAAEETAEEYAEGPLAPWHAPRPQPDNEDGQLIEGEWHEEPSPDEVDKEDLEIERIATKFGRGGSRRRRAN